MAVGFSRIVFCLYCVASDPLASYPHGVPSRSFPTEFLPRWTRRTERTRVRPWLGASARAETCRFAGKVIDNETSRRLWINGEAADVMRKGADGRRISEPD